MKYLVLTFVGLVAVGGAARVALAEPNLPPVDAAALARWQDMRFGMFVHWGPVALKGTEIGWSRGRQVPVEEYDGLYKRFNPTKFDADEWIATAKAAGMKYFVITSKHHDGFCLWDSKLTDYDIMSTPLGRDVLGELSAACKRQGVMFCTYHSICDWHHPDYPTDSPGGKGTKPNPNIERYVEYLKGQLREIVTGYGPVGVMWFDGEWEKPWTHAMGLDLYRYVRSLQDDILINNRVDKGRHGMEGGTASREFAGDFDTPEQRVGTFQIDRPWESCITICRQWAWKPDDKLKTLDECIRTLVTTAGGGGNLLLNVGPMPDGRIEPRQAQRLREIGAWLEKYGESIYATRGGPFEPGPYGVTTHKGNRVYVHVLAWDGPAVALPAIDAKIEAASVLGGGRAQVKQTANGVNIAVAEQDRHQLDTIVVLELKQR